MSEIQEISWQENQDAKHWELIVERYIYLRNTQKQQKITNYGRNKSFLEFYLVYNCVCWNF